MESIINYVSSLQQNIGHFWKSAAIMLIAPILLALIGRSIFGKKSILCSAVSSAIGILFVYALTIVLANSGTTFQKLIAPLPFVSFQDDSLLLFSFQSDYTLVCTQILSMIILSFLMNLVDRWLPNGKHLFGWFFFRFIDVVIALILHVAVSYLFTKYLPEGLVIYAPTILLALLIIMLLTGALKFLVGLILTSVNPLVAALYTFFFANFVGKQITKAVFTTAILAGLIVLLQKIGIYAISIASAALITYIPLMIILVALWYIVKKFL